MKKAKFDTAGIGTALFDAVSSGKITTEEYKTAIKGLNIVKKVIQ